MTGFQNSSKLFSEDIVEATLLGQPIQNGVHRLLVEHLGDLTAEPTADETRRQMAPQILSIIGFQPRHIAGTDDLSNHVYGLAIDINAKWNPYIKNPYVVEIIKRHTDPPILFDQPFLKAGESIDQIDAKLTRASEQIRRWLSVAMATKTRLETNLSVADAQAGAAESILYNAKTDEEKKSASEARDRARSELTKAQQEIDESQDTFEVKVLAEEWSWATLENWQSVGLFTIPIDLAKQLKERGFGWGNEWKTKKDAMHFELDPKLLGLEGAGDFPIQDSGSLTG
jgi:D-alanyl-D-alanine carboxypeptidase